MIEKVKAMREKQTVLDRSGVDNAMKRASMMSVSAQYQNKTGVAQPSMEQEEGEPKNQSKSLENQMDMSSKSDDSNSNESESKANMDNEIDDNLYNPVKKNI